MTMAVDLEKLEDSPHLLDLLVQVEDVIDSFDLYVFDGWMDCEVVEGPHVRRYWIDVVLKAPYKKMPDPKGALRLLKHGVRVNYSKAREEGGKDVEIEEGDDTDKEGNSLVWLVRLSVPRRLIQEMNAGELDFYDEEIDADDVEDAQDQGVTDESGYTDDGQTDPNNPEGDDQEMGGDDPQNQENPNAKPA
jgi:hypothetical protein